MLESYREYIYRDREVCIAVKQMKLKKRFFDVIIAGFLLAAAWPVMLLSALLIRWNMGNPILFRHVRPGIHGVPFTVYKFRTMRDELGHSGKPLPDAERLTPSGKLLRRLSLDELPQLFNVLKGDMSIIGPRPLLTEYLPLYNREQVRRHEVKPGITGWAQVKGRNALSWEEKFKLDVWYVDNWSIWLDIRIFFLTIGKLLKMEGINQPGQATMEKFRGNKSNDRFKDWKFPEIEDGTLTKYNWLVQHKDNLKLGYKTDIGAFTYINAKNGVIIEDFVQIGSHCSIYSISTIDNREGQVVLKKNCKIGSHTVIMPGVTVGENSTIGAFSFVTKNIPDNVTAAGVPARVVKENPED